jgi:hypothetical protein
MNKRHHTAAPELAVAIVLILGSLLLAGNVPAAENPPELGEINWLRRLDAAKAESRASGKPILLLFQEIPGCQTCQTFGAQPLSHPLLVEAIEDLFVPLAIHNNKAGEDETILKRFQEPAWNNPVIRYLDANENDLIPRKDRQWSVGDTALRMVAALSAAGREVPNYLRLVADEHHGPTETAVVAMHCYWEGEGQLGALAAVEKTWSGWLGGKEVVEITYDPSKAGYEEILRAAKGVKCADHVFALNPDQARIAKSSTGLATTLISAGESVRTAKDSDQQYYLRQSLLRHLPLTTLQATRINAALRQKQDGTTFLSPRQKQMLSQVAKVADADWLEDMVYPTAANKLADYSRRLGQALATHSKKD